MVIKGLLLILLVNTFCRAKQFTLKHDLALKMFVENHKNIIVSPMMILFPLCKLASVAEGTAKNELLTILEIRANKVQNCYTDLENIITGLKRMDLLSLNKIIVNYTDDVSTKFISNETNYGVRVDKVGYNYPNLAISFVNRWVDKATYKRITKVLEPGDINNNSSMIIVNAAYLKVTWEFPFDIRLTKDMKFHHQNGNISLVPMMSKIVVDLYLDDKISNTQYITIKLASFGVTMTLMIPQRNRGLPELLRKLLNEPNYINEVRKRLKYETVKIILPRFKIKSGLDLNEYLRKIGVSVIFNETNSGLNGILKDNSKVKNIYLSKIKQKNFFDVDEMGIYRQLPKEMHEELPGRSSFTKEIVFDHPFYFTVNIQKDLLNNDHIFNIFQGVYYGPED